MPLKQPKRRRRAVSVTSLIDVIFLLLLFFMLTSTFTKFAEVPLSGAGAAQASAPAEGVPPLFLKLAADSVRLNGEAVELADVADIAQDLAEGAETVLLISIADEAVTSQRLVDVLIALQAAPVTVQVLD